MLQLLTNKIYHYNIVNILFYARSYTMNFNIIFTFFQYVFKSFTVILMVFFVI